MVSIMVKVKLSEAAIADLQQIKDYITDELCNEKAAVNTVTKITKRLRILADYPQSGAPLSGIADIETDYRFLVCGNYTAFYRFEGQTVEVSRILYGRRDIMRILFGESEEDEV